MPRLTRRTVAALAATDQEYFVWDTVQKGLGVRVQANGTPFYVVKYYAGGRSRRLTLGSVSELTLDEARDLAAKHRLAVRDGGDPGSDRRARRNAPTVRELGADFLDDVDARRKPKTAAGYRSQWKRYILPALGGRQVAAVTRADVAALHRRVSRTHKVTANRVSACLGAFFSYAERQGLRTDTPVRKIERNRENPRQRFLTGAEFLALGQALATAEREGLPVPEDMRRKKGGKHRPKSADKPVPADPFAVAAVRMLALTGWRAGEAFRLRWNDLDLDQSLARLPDTKTGASVRPLSAAARAVLDVIPRVSGNPWVFVGARRGSHLAGVRRLWVAAREAAGLKDLRLHDLRHSHASMAAGSGVSLLLIGGMLGHKQPATSARYAHLANSPLLVAADATADAISRAMTGPATETAVTPLRRKRRAR
jgi:integrase